MSFIPVPSLPDSDKKKHIVMAQQTTIEPGKKLSLIWSQLCYTVSWGNKYVLETVVTKQMMKLILFCNVQAAILDAETSWLG